MTIHGVFGPFQNHKVGTVSSLSSQ